MTNKDERIKLRQSGHIVSVNTEADILRHLYLRHVECSYWRSICSRRASYSAFDTDIHVTCSARRLITVVP